MKILKEDHQIYLILFDILDTGFFSVGQNPDYKKIYNYLDKMPINPFEALNDIAYNLELLDLYINKKVLRSL